MFWGVLVVLVSAPAWAWPVDVVQDLELGKEKFVPLSSLEWFDVEDSKIATVEHLESGEILFTPLKPGRTLVLLYSEKRFAVWRLRVAGSPPLDAKPLTVALKACPKLAHHPAAYDKLAGGVGDEKCRLALLTLLATDAFLAKELDLTFEQPVLQMQLRMIEAALAASKLKVGARYEGISLVLTGSADATAKKKAIWEVFRASAGRVAMDDQIEVGLEPETPSDAGLLPTKR